MKRFNSYSNIILGHGPGIHECHFSCANKLVDGRAKPGHDG